jgi:hypothetical protein
MLIDITFLPNNRAKSAKKKGDHFGTIQSPPVRKRSLKLRGARIVSPEF